MGWPIGPGPPSAGNFPAIFLEKSRCWSLKRELSIFIDESGDFGKLSKHSPYYIVAFVFHEQSTPIGTNIVELDRRVADLGFPHHAIHTGPLIRRESVYGNNSIEERRRLFNALFHFARRAPLQYEVIKIRKADCTDPVQFNARMAGMVKAIIVENFEYLHSFDSIIVYYDNGQIELTKILTAVFHSLLTNVTFKKVVPVNFKLFQVADLICTMELLEMKLENGSELTNSEIQFFGNRKNFRKNYYKHMVKKQI